jgi:hypothetical protein
MTSSTVFDSSTRATLDRENPNKTNSILQCTYSKTGMRVGISALRKDAELCGQAIHGRPLSPALLPEGTEAMTGCRRPLCSTWWPRSTIRTLGNVGYFGDCGLNILRGVRAWLYNLNGRREKCTAATRLGSTGRSLCSFWKHVPGLARIGFVSYSPSSLRASERRSLSTGIDFSCSSRRRNRPEKKELAHVPVFPAAKCDSHRVPRRRHIPSLKSDLGSMRLKTALPTFHILLLSLRDLFWCSAPKLIRSPISTHSNNDRPLI